MNANEIEMLKDACGKRIELRCSDGEGLIADVLFVSDDELDVIYDLISTTKLERYLEHTSGAAWSTPFDQIESFKALGGE